LAKPNTPRIFATLASSTLAGLEALASKVDSPEVGLELRLDHLKERNGLESALDQILSRLHSPPVIATCRRTEAGGLFDGTIEQQGSLLAAAVRAGCQWVDVEIESVERAGVSWLEQFKPAKVIVSYHNYRAAPPLPAIYRRLARLPVESVKVACHMRRLCDNLRILDLLKSHRNRGRKLVALGMGGTGIPSRVLALRYGSAFTYGSAGNHLSVAPGQLPSEVMRTVYRVEHLDRRTQLFGVAGSRASLSLSPAMQNAAFQGKHIDAVYLPCETDRLADFLAFARRLNFQGFSVTMPFKRGIIRSLDWLDPLAARIGACNTVAVQRGKWLGWNTDAAAVAEVLAKRLRLAGSRILILGAGGAARAAAYTLRAEGAVVLISARRELAAQRLARGISAQVVPWEGTEVIDVDAVINATPVGMTPQVEARPIDFSRVRTRVVFDMVYHPLETRFLTQARGRGLITISGLEMLVAQGARQFEIWTGSTAPRALMEQAARQVLSHAGA
jgi:3-dehydroquinate dehydratase / shikimate dehydrogenase